MLCRRILFLFPAFLFPLTVCAADLNEALWVAARRGDAQAVKDLLAKGADVNAKFRYGATALSYAADRGHLEVVRVLLEHGADVNVKDTFYGASPLSWAASKGHVEVVRALLEKGADAGKEAALMMGANRGHLDIVQAVLARGGLNPEALTSALAQATKAGHTEIAELLKKAGAVPPPKPDFQVDPETLKSYVGTYKGQDGGELIFTVKDGKLAGGPAGQNPLVMGAIDKVTFRPLEIEGITVTFHLEGGKVVSLTLKQGGRSSVFKKADEK